MRFIFRLFVALLLAGCSPAERSQKIDPITPMRGIYWYGRGWPGNFWTTDLLRYADEDFRQMKSDGFNTVFLLVPWAGFVEPQTGKINSMNFDKLDKVIEKSKKAKLNVGLRLGYSQSPGYDSYKDSVDLFTSIKAYAAWLAFFTEIGRRYDNDASIVERIISWEDLWQETDVASSPLRDRIEFGKESGFRGFLSHQNSLAQISKIYKTAFPTWNAIPVPSRDSPAFSLFLDYLKEAFQKRFYEPASAKVKNLTFELRTDEDPIFDGPKFLNGYDWSSTWAVLSPKQAVVYYNPYYGSANTGKALTPERALLGLNFLLDRIRAKVGATPIFIDQFNLRDETPGFHNDYVSDTDLPRFLKLSKSAINGTAGYAFWFFRGYKHNRMSNPDFSQGLEDWQFAGSVMPFQDGVRLGSGAWLRNSTKGRQGAVGNSPVTVCVTLQGHTEGGGLEILGDTNAVLYTLSAPTASPSIVCKTGRDQISYKFVAYGSDVSISLIEVFSFFQAGTIYKVDGSPGLLLGPTRAFNRQVFNASAILPEHLRQESSVVRH